LAESRHFDHTYAAFKCHRNHVALPHHAARRINARSVHAHVSRTGERSRGAARAHQPGVPQPPIDALAIFNAHSTALLGVGLELGFQRRQLGKRRIRVGRLFVLPTFEPQRMVAIARATGPFLTMFTTLLPTAWRPCGFGRSGRPLVLARRHLSLGRTGRKPAVALALLARSSGLVPTLLATRVPRPPLSFAASWAPDLDQHRLLSRLRLIGQAVGIRPDGSILARNLTLERFCRGRCTV
jgi:hypothetical protein